MNSNNTTMNSSLAGAAESSQAGSQTATPDTGSSPKIKDTGAFSMDEIEGGQIYPLKFNQGSHKITLIRERVHMVRLIGLIFDSNKCFLLPYALPGIKQIIQMHEKYKTAEVLIVGHAGSDEDLAGADIAFDRAQILGAYLKNKPTIWLNWFGPDKNERSRWGTREIQLMLSALPDLKNCFYSGFASGISDEKTTSAIKKFQEYMKKEKNVSLPVDGKVDFETRKALVEAYMNIEGTSFSEEVHPVAHGCEGHFKGKTTSTGNEADDRRIEVLFFEKMISPRPQATISTEGTSFYPKWVSRVVEIVDYEHHGIHIQIIDAKNKPAPLAKVTLKGPVNAESTADEYGFVSFFNLKKGEYTINSEKNGYKIGASKITYPTAKTIPGYSGKSGNGKDRSRK